MWLHACWWDTSDLSCFPKYMSEEMAFTSPNFCWAAPELVTASGFLLAVGLKINQHVWKHNKYLTILISRAIKTAERCTCHALMWWWESRRSQAQDSRSHSSSPSPPLRLPIGRKNDPGFDPHHERSSFKKHPKRHSERPSSSPNTFAPWARDDTRTLLVRGQNFYIKHIIKPTWRWCTHHLHHPQQTVSLWSSCKDSPVGWCACLRSQSETRRCNNTGQKQNTSQKWKPKFLRQRSLPPLHRTSWPLDPSRVSRPALFSSHPVLSASAPPIFCAARGLCMPDARTDHWRTGRASELVQINAPPGKIIKHNRSGKAYMDSSGWAFFLLEAADSSCSLSLSTAWAFFSSSEKFRVLTFWAPRPPFLEANYKETQHQCLCSTWDGRSDATVHTVFLAAAGFFLIRDGSSGKTQDR